MSDDGNTKANDNQPAPERAVLLMAAMRQFGQLPHDAQVSVANNICGMLGKVLEQTTDSVGEGAAAPLALAVTLVEGLFKTNGRVIFLREAEAGVTFHQASALVLRTGEGELSVNFIPPKAGHGDRAAGAAGLAMRLMSEHSAQAARSLLKL